METGSIQEIILLILAVCKCTLFFALEFVRRSGEKGKNQDFFIFQFAKCMTDAILRYPNDVGEMAERLKAQHWKCCLGEILTRVRISLSPPFIFSLPISGKKRIFYSKVLKVVGVKEFAQIAEVCLKHTQNLKKGLFQRKITTSASEF